MSNILVVYILYIFLNIWSIYYLMPKSTYMYYILFNIFISIISSILLIKSKWYFILIINIFSFFIILLKYFKDKNIVFKDKRKIYSLSMFYNYFTNNYKINKNDYIFKIGNIIPYKKWQLKYNNKLIYADSDTYLGGSIITGASGSGKTMFLQSQMYQAVKQGLSLVYFDLKGDKEIINNLYLLGEKYKLFVYEMSSYNINFNYDPLINLSNPGRVEALLNMRKWSSEGNDSFYKTGVQNIIQELLNEFNKNYNKNKNYTYEFYKFVNTYKPRKENLDSYYSLTQILDLMFTSNLENAFKNKLENDFNFNTDNQFICIFSFSSDSKELANSVASLVFRDILKAASNRENKKLLYLAIDEFGSMTDTRLISDLFQKGRSDGIISMASVQDINQFNKDGNKAFVLDLLGTIKNLFIFPGSIRDTAELMSDIQSDKDIEEIIMNLHTPNKSKNMPPTSLFISKKQNLQHKYPQDVFKFNPYIPNSLLNLLKLNNKNNKDYDIKEIKNTKSKNIKIKIVDQNTKNKYMEEFKEDESFKQEIKNIENLDIEIDDFL